MKKILSLLMCYVFLLTQSFAGRGGPGGGGSQGFSGLYAGVMTPDTTDPKNNLAQVGSDIGLFLLSVPATGPATGTIVVYSFTIGGQFNGSINGIADPGSGSGTATLTGIFQANATVGVQTVAVVGAVPTVTTTTLDFTMAGSLKLTPSQTTNAASAQRVYGHGVSTIAVTSGGGAINNVGANYTNFIFDGFQQSASATTLASFGASGGGGGAGGAGG